MLQTANNYFHGPRSTFTQREVYEYRVEATLLGGGPVAYYVVADTPAAARAEVLWLYPGVDIKDVSFSGRRFVVTPEGDDFKTQKAAQ